MPVVNVRLGFLQRTFPDLSQDEIIAKVPYVGLDIELIDPDQDLIKLEFNPNRPDFASENGIIRALKGILGVEVGMPSITNIQHSQQCIFVDEKLKNIRPLIYGLTAKRKIPLSNTELTQLISIQEDLHNGLGRKRKKSSIGLHNYDALTFPLQYRATTIERKFVPLDSVEETSLGQILHESEIGKRYGNLLKKSDLVPILEDDHKRVVSFPPIINGSISKIDTNTRNLFVEVTATNFKTAKEMLAILSYELVDMRFELFNVTVHSPFEGNVISPNLDPIIIEADVDKINNTLGLDLVPNKIIECLHKSRCNGIVTTKGTVKCIAPSYRIDLFDINDVIEEVAIGYGINNLIPDYPEVYFGGKKNNHSLVFDKIRETLVGLGFVEIINPNIISKKALEQTFIFEKELFDKLIWLGDSQNAEYEVLRTSLIPSTINTLSFNIHERYPQKFFEIGKIFRGEGNSIYEAWSLCGSIAHDSADYTEIKSNLESFMKYCFDKTISTPRVQTGYLLNGHSAKVMLDTDQIGLVGEIHPQVLSNHNMRTLVSLFEIDLSKIIELLSLTRQDVF
jgi:phenylalanyl-tRNA synthetase beta chain